MKAKWSFNNSNTDGMTIENIAQKVGVSKFVIGILFSRGIRTLEEIDSFLNPRLSHLHSPKYMKDMDKGTDIVLKAIKDNKNIVIYGDYDCDGITSTAIMYKGLLRCGGKVSYHIPDRIEEGYGLNSETIKKLYEKGYEVIITCDNGISGIEQVALAKSFGMTVIITDHHEVPFIECEDGERREILPDADAVINPKQKNCNYPFKYLCGAGVAFKFIHTIYHKLKIETKELYELIELAMLGTVCDVVDLMDENRVIVSIGLRMLNQTKNLGLKALIREAGYEGKRLRAGVVGFQIGPCINATGRLYSADLAVELLLTKDSELASKLAKRLRQLNQARQDMTEKALNNVIDQIESSSLKNDKVLVVCQKDMHESIAGIVAGRVKERYNKPALVITLTQGKAKGSGRSIEEYNMFEEISKCRDILLTAGGHPMAAGFCLLEDNIPLFRQRLNEHCSLNEEDFAQKILIDEIINIEDITFELVNDIEKLEPFGKGNKEPIFAAENIYINRIDIIGKNKDTFKLSCSQKYGGVSIPAICFCEVDRLKKIIGDTYGEDFVSMVLEDPLSHGLKMDIIFKPTINEWNGSLSLQMQVMDYRIS